MSAPWDDETKLLLPRSGLDSELRANQRALARQRTVCQRAARAGRDGVPFEAGDPKTGKPWRPGDDVVLAYESGVEDARWLAQWEEERRQGRMVAQAGKVLRKADREHRRQAKARAERRKHRARRTWAVARFVAPIWSGRVRRWHRALTR